ncbi:MAG: hypothetical protein WCC53_12245 [Thermoanaerobaculia bacterium]|jgi:hypothetical protein
MKALPAAPAFLAVLLAGGCASSPWLTTENVPGGRLYVPKVHAPLLPGSIYPDRRVLVPAKGRPALILVCPAKGRCRGKEILDQAAQRGLVVLALKGSSESSTTGDFLRTRTEADPRRIGSLLVSPTGVSLRKWTGAGAPGDAVAVLWPAPPPATLLPSSPSGKIFLAALFDKEPPEAKDGTVLKLYAPDRNGALPNEAFRDAVEWLAGEVGAR